jgi:DNA polymerase
MLSVELAGPTDFDGFRAAARALLLEQVPPEHVSFRAGSGSHALFGSDGSVARVDTPAPGALKVPRAFLDLARKASLHRDPARFALLYRLLWRMRAEPRLLAVDVDEDVAVVRAWSGAVERDIHKMHAYVRFREIKGVEPRVYVAWFEPTHHVVAEAAPFFVRRFPHMRWTILTPETSAIWDTCELRFGPGGRRSDAPADDAAEDLWRSYYASIFNPARLNVRAMQSHMPKKYWGNLPESAKIPELVRSAAPRTHAMIAAGATEPAKRHRLTAARAAGAAARMPTTESLRNAPLPANLPELAERVRHCRGCGLWRTATQAVFGQGPIDARAVFVGEQPGDQEDIKGAPFVGPAGKLFDRALREAGVDRAAVYVTNAVKHFKFEPRGKRRLHKTPSQLELAACRDWLEREIAIIRPKLLVALGATAARALLRRDVAVRASRGQLFEDRQRPGTQLLVTMHPSYLLRLSAAERVPAYRAFVGDLALAAHYLRREH